MIAAIRVRGRVGTSRQVEDTLNMLRLSRVNHLVLVDDNPSYKGMLDKVKDYITWGEIDSETLSKMLAKRGRLMGNRRIGDYFLKNTKYKTIPEFSEALLKKEAELPKEIKPVFRLHPPRKGYGGIKKSYKNKGALGYRGADINKLIQRMI